MSNDEAVENIERRRTVDVDAATEEVEVGDRTFPVVDAGEGPAVMLFHGFPDSRRLWRYQVPALVEAGFRVVAPDLRGFGDAPKPQEVEAYELPTIVEEDVLAIMDALDIEESRVVGHDWGAHVAWLTALTVPDRVEQVAVLSSGSPDNSGYLVADQMSSFWHVYFFQFEAAEAQLRHDDWRLFRDWCEGGDDVERYVEELSRPGALTAGLNWYRANIRPEPPEKGEAIPDLTCPVMGVLAEDDPYLNEPQMARSHEKIDLTEGSWRYETVESGHWMPVDAPVEVNRLLVDFFDS
jgi:pimeloyl-ACP methyl ester carboxylesterase